MLGVSIYDTQLVYFKYTILTFILISLLIMFQKIQYSKHNFPYQFVFSTICFDRLMTIGSIITADKLKMLFFNLYIHSKKYITSRIHIIRF